MKNCVQIQNRFDLSLLDAVTPVFHRTYSKRQKYNKTIDSKYDLVPTSTYSIPDNVVLNLIKQLPKSVLDIEVPQVFILRMDSSDADLPVLAAHVDFNRSCGINIYIEANGERTHYYEWDSETKTLIETESFVANANDCWLMDTQIPHSVSLVSGKQRSMLTYSFVKTPYEKIKEAICANDF